MRTTVRLDDDLLREAKRYAAEKGITLTAMLDQALREILARQEGPIDLERIPLPTFKGTGLRPGVDLDDTASLLDLMERDRDSS
jgi:hypothetical protein